MLTASLLRLLSDLILVRLISVDHVQSLKSPITVSDSRKIENLERLIDSQKSQRDELSDQIDFRRVARELKSTALEDDLVSESLLSL